MYVSLLLGEIWDCAEKRRRRQYVCILFSMVTCVLRGKNNTFESVTKIYFDQVSKMLFYEKLHDWS